MHTVKMLTVVNTGIRRDQIIIKSGSHKKHRESKLCAQRGKKQPEML